MSVEETRELCRRWLLELWHGELSVAGEIVAPGFVGHWPSHDVHGPAGVAEAIGQGRSPFQDISISLDLGPIADGDKVAAQWTFRATYHGGLPGATAAAGTRVAFSGVDILRVDPASRKIVEYWVVSDALKLMTQLGALPAP